MNIVQYKKLKESGIEAFSSETLYVSPKTLFRKSEFAGLTVEECSAKAIELGWRWDFIKGKYYRVIGY